MKRKIALFIYYIFARHLPPSTFPIVGRYSKIFRAFLCKHIFKECGSNINVEHGAFFGNGANVIIGNNSGIGLNARIPNNISIGNGVMMAPDVIIFSSNHITTNTEIPMYLQGATESVRTIIEDDVWIGQRVIMTPGRHIKIGSIIAAGCVLCKDFPEYSVIGGNPSKLIKLRK